MSCKKLRRIWVDGTYRGKLLDWVSDHCWFLLEPVLRSDEMKGFVLLKRRWVVERTFAWLTQCRRLGKDYERQWFKPIAHLQPRSNLEKEE